MNTKIEKTAEIQVLDERGNELTMSEMTRFTEFKPLSGTAEWIKGARAYELNGEHCNAIDADTWKTLDSGRILRRA